MKNVFHGREVRFRESYKNLPCAFGLAAAVNICVHWKTLFKKSIVFGDGIEG